MQTMTRTAKLAAIWAFALILTLAQASGAWALQVNDRLRIDGFMYQGYAATSNNTFLGIDEDGTFDFNALTLLFKADVTDQFSVWTKLFAESLSGDTVLLDWAFGQYRFNDRLAVKIGKFPTPIGLYNEVRGVFPVIPLSLLPAFYFHGSELAPELIEGLSVNTVLLPGDWSATLDAYVGETHFLVESVPFKNMRGGQLWFSGPDKWIRLGQGYFYGEDKSGTVLGPPAVDTAMSTAVSSAEVTLPFGLSIRGERGTHWHPRVDNHNHTRRFGYWAEATWLLADRFTPVVRRDVFIRNIQAPASPSGEQVDDTAGLNIRVTDYMYWKGEYHRIRGTTLLSAASNPTPDEVWALWITSLTFVF
jgi:hypothetical protein